jgi:predicted DNA binding CopG/RHH family protein
VVYTQRRLSDGKQTTRIISARRRTAKNVRPIPDSEIDFSDIPPSTDEELKRARRVGRAAKSFKYVPDSELDLSDIPETTEEEIKRARRVGRPLSGNAKILIAIRIAPRVLAGLRRAAAKQQKPYQTYIHDVLEKAVSKRVA